MEKCAQQISTSKVVAKSSEKQRTICSQ